MKVTSLVEAKPSNPNRCGTIYEATSVLIHRSVG